MKTSIQNKINLIVCFLTQFTISNIAFSQQAHQATSVVRSTSSNQIEDEYAESSEPSVLKSTGYVTLLTYSIFDYLNEDLKKSNLTTNIEAQKKALSFYSKVAQQALDLDEAIESLQSISSITENTRLELSNRIKNFGKILKNSELLSYLTQKAALNETHPTSQILRARMGLEQLKKLQNSANLIATMTTLPSTNDLAAFQYKLFNESSHINVARTKLHSDKIVSERSGNIKTQTAALTKTRIRMGLQQSLSLISLGGLLSEYLKLINTNEVSLKSF